MQIALILMLVTLVSLMLLLPTLSFARAALRYIRSPRVDASLATRSLMSAGAFMPLAINLGYLSLAWPGLLAGNLEPDRNLAVAVLIAWVAFWGRVVLARRTPRRRARRA